MGSPRTRRKWAGFVAIAALVVGTLVGSLIARRSTVAVNAPTRALASAWGQRFSTEARLSGGFHYRRASASDVPARQNLEFLTEAGRIQREAQQAPDAANLHAWGVAQLLLGEVDEAIETLQTSMALGGETSSLFSDLAAAHMTRATRERRAMDWALALEAADRALEINPANREAAFNRALSLKNIGLTEQAATAWDEYLQEGRTDAWAVEGEAQLIELGRPADPLPTAATCESEWLDAAYTSLDRAIITWARAQAATTAPIAVPDDAAVLADCIAARVGERYYQSLYDAARRAPATTAKALLSLDEAETATTKGALLEAATIAERLQPTLDRLHPVRLRVDSMIGARLYRDGRMVEAMAFLSELIERCERLGFGAIAAQAETARGAVFFNHADYDESLRRHQGTMRIYERLRLRRGLAGAYGYASDAAQSLSDYEAAWDLHVKALRDTAIITSVPVRQALFSRPQESATLQGLNRVALQFGRAAIARATLSGNTLHRCSSRRESARALGRMSRADEALRLILESHPFCEAITDPSIKLRADAETQSALAEALLDHDPAASEIAARTALAHYASAKWQKRQPALFRTLGGALRRQNRSSDAAIALDRGINLVEAYEADVRNADQRPGYIDGLWELYGDQLSVQADSGDVAGAFATGDRGMAHSLRTSMTYTADELQSRLRAGELLLMPVVTSERLYVFSVTHEAIRLAVADVPRHRVAQAVRWLSLSLQSPELASHAEEAASVLASWMIVPFEAQIAASAVLMVAADPVLQSVPFGFLPAVRHEAERKLVDRVVVVMCPSASLCVSDASPVNANVSGQVSVIRQAEGGDPLPRLNWEVDEISRLYAGATINDASISVLRSALQDAEVVHYAGHAFVDSGPGGRSMLLLPELPGGTATRRPINEIVTKPIGAKLVVLSACSTVRGRVFRGEGMIAMSTAFLRYGAANVVGTLWDVRDDAASELFVAFHQHLARGASPAEALTFAQRHQRAAGRAAIDWTFPVIVVRARPTLHFQSQLEPALHSLGGNQ